MTDEGGIMRMFKPWVVVLAGLALALSYSVPARAITKKTANDKGAGYQHYECSARGAHCIKPNWNKNQCHGPFRGETQWVCSGTVLLSYSGAIDECQIISRWGPWGNLVFGRRYCSSIGIQEN